MEVQLQASQPQPPQQRQQHRQVITTRSSCRTLPGLLSSRTSESLDAGKRQGLVSAASGRGSLRSVWPVLRQPAGSSLSGV